MEGHAKKKTPPDLLRFMLEDPFRDTHSSFENCSLHTPCAPASLVRDLFSSVRPCAREALPCLRRVLLLERGGRVPGDVSGGPPASADP